MTSDVGLDYLLGDDPVGVDLQIADGAAEQRGPRRIGTTADTHIEHRVASDSPELLGRDVDQHLAMVVAALRLCQLPAATLHIDGQFPAFCRVGGLFQLVTQLLVYITNRLRS